MNWEPALQGWVATDQTRVPESSVATPRDRETEPSRAMKSRAWPVTSWVRAAVTWPDCHETVPTVVMPVIAVRSAYGSKNYSASVPSGR